MGRHRAPRVRINPERLSRRCISLKVCHETRDKALDAAEATMLEGRVSPGCHLVPYLCSECGSWHVRNKQIIVVPGEHRRLRPRKDAP